MSEIPRRPHVALEVDPHAASPRFEEALDRTFEIVVIGDFSGRALGARGVGEPPGERRAVPVRSVDEALSLLRPAVDLDLDGGRTTLAFEELEDFHPDRLVRAVPALRALVEEIEVGPTDPGGGATEPEAGPGEPEAAPADAEDSAAEPKARTTEPKEASAAGLLDDIVAAAPEQAPSRGSRALEDLKPWLREVVAPYLGEAPAAPDAGTVRDRTAAASARLREVLHHHAVQGLERIWRSLFFLLRAVDAVEAARLHLLDLSRADLEALLSDGEVGAASLARILRDAPSARGADAPPALLLLDCAFGPEPADVLLLNRLAMTAHGLGAPLLAAASPSLLGVPSFEELPPAGEPLDPSPAWSAFRETEAAASVALLAPRVLVREPYGPRTEPCEAFDFDELDGGLPGPYLWGSPAFVAAAAAVEALAAEGWGLALDAPREMDGMPIHVTPSGGVGAHPTEAVWPLDVVERAFAAGVDPVVGFKGQARVRLPGVSSVSRSREPLHSWW